MKDWIRLNTFSRVHQAEWRKHFLKEANINAIVMQKMDSAFLLGEYELYVEATNVEKARGLIDAFVGWTKINSFHKYKQIELMQKIVEAEGIETKTLDKVHNSYLLDKYALYVKTEDAEKALEIVQAPKGWQNVILIHDINQVAYRVDLLKSKNIDCLIVKSRNSDMHVETVKIFVQKAQADEAEKILSDLPGWVKVDSFTNEAFAKTLQRFLEKNEVAPITKVNLDENKVSNIDFYVPAEIEEQVRALIAENKKWEVVKSFGYLVHGEFYRDMLVENGIDAVLFTKKDSAFLIGDIELYVELNNRDKAIELIEKVKEFDEKELE